jgi:hypothetical protein
MKFYYFPQILDLIPTQGLGEKDIEPLTSSVRTRMLEVFAGSGIGIPETESHDPAGSL